MVFTWHWKCGTISFVFFFVFLLFISFSLASNKQVPLEKNLLKYWHNFVSLFWSLVVERRTNTTRNHTQRYNNHITLIWIWYIRDIHFKNHLRVLSPHEHSESEPEMWIFWGFPLSLSLFRTYMHLLRMLLNENVIQRMSLILILVTRYFFNQITLTVGSDSDSDSFLVLLVVTTHLNPFIWTHSMFFLHFVSVSKEGLVFRVFDSIFRLFRTQLFAFVFIFFLPCSHPRINKM